MTKSKLDEIEEAVKLLKNECFNNSEFRLIAEKALTHIQEFREKIPRGQCFHAAILSAIQRDVENINLPKIEKASEALNDFVRGG